MGIESSDWFTRFMRLELREINFDYSYLNNNKKAIEIWTIQDSKVYIINYVANEKVYDTTLPLVQKMIESFEITI